MNELRNRVQLIGHLGSDPETKTFDSGKSKVTFSIATNERFKSKSGDWVTETQWHNIVAWDKLGEKMSKNLAKGKEALIVGKLTHRSYDGSNGEKKYITEINATDFETFEKSVKKEEKETV